MKRSLLLPKVVKAFCVASALLVSSFASAQLTESFNSSSTPTNWGNYNYTGGTGAASVWKFGGSPGYAMGNTNDHTGNGGEFAWVDGSLPYPLKVALESPAVTLNSVPYPVLQFYMRRNTSGYTITAMNTVTVDFYDGVSWHNEIYTHTNQTANGAWEQIQVPLYCFEHLGDYKIRINVDKTGSPSYYDDVAVDDIEIVSGPDYDASASEIITPSFPGCTLDTILNVAISNYAADTITSMNVNFSVNGVAFPPYNWIGSLMPCQIDTVNLGLVNGLAFGDTILVWPSNINGGALDLDTSNDTIMHIYYEGLSGTYTVGATAGNDFPDFTSAVQAIELRGLCGPVVFEVEDGTYNENITIKDYPTSNSVNTVTFRSQSGDNTAVVLSHTTASGNGNFAVRLWGAQYFRFEDMTIQNLGSGNSRVFVIRTNAHHNEVTNCIITAPTTTSTGSGRALIFSGDGSNNDNNSFVGNTMNNGSSAFYFDGDFSNRLENYTIQDNEMLNQYYAGVYTIYGENFVVEGNYISSDNTSSTSRGVYLSDSENMKVLDNYVDEGAEEYYYGVYMAYSNGGLLDRGLVVGNRVKYGYAGIYLDNCFLHEVSNNTIFASNAASATSRGLYIYNGSNNGVYNNNSNNGANGYAYYLSGSPVYMSDYNNFYSSGNNAFYFGGNQADLTGFISNTNLDSNSFEVITSITDTISLKTCNDTLNNSGIANAYSNFDFEDDARNVSTSDIGADEFESLSSFTLGADQVLCNGDSITLSAYYFDTVIWNGLDTTNEITVLSPASYTVFVNGVCGSKYDTIAILQQQPSALPSQLNLCAGQSSDLDPGITNGTYNWTGGLNTQVLTVSAPGTYVVTIVDQYGCNTIDSTEVTQSVAVNLPDTVVELCTGGSVFLDAAISGSYNWAPGGGSASTLNVTSAGTYTVTVTDPASCVSIDSAEVVEVGLPVVSFSESTWFFTTTLTNNSQNGSSYLWDFGDGTTSTDENPGSHVYPWTGGNTTYVITLTVTNQCGSDTDTLTVVAGPNGVDELSMNQNISAYPNPVKNELNFVYSSSESEDFSVELVSVTGQVILRKDFGRITNGETKSIDMSSLATGVYFVKVKLNSEEYIQRVIKQ